MGSARESRTTSRRRVALHALQLLPGSPDVARNARDGSWIDRPRLGACRNRRVACLSVTRKSSRLRAACFMRSRIGSYEPPSPSQSRPDAKRTLNTIAGRKLGRVGHPSSGAWTVGRGWRLLPCCVLVRVPLAGSLTVTPEKMIKIWEEFQTDPLPRAKRQYQTFPNFYVASCTPPYYNTTSTKREARNAHLPNSSRPVLQNKAESKSVSPPRAPHHPMPVAPHYSQRVEPAHNQPNSTLPLPPKCAKFPNEAISMCQSSPA
jgi:hypothetical protein